MFTINYLIDKYNLDVNSTELCLSFFHEFIEDLDGIEKFTNLEYLNLSNNNIKCLDKLSSLCNIKRLHISKCGLTSLKGIEHLDLNYMNIGCNNIEDIYIILKMKNLKYFLYYSTPFSNKTVTSKNIEQVKSILKMELRKEKIKALCSLQKI